MKKESVESLLKEIEELRSKLYTLTQSKELESHHFGVDDPLLKISKKLDKLILKYMKYKKANK